jgi:two-component system sensor histidine kinase RegB
MGVGLFLTYTTIKRIGGKITFSNIESGGAIVAISLPLLTTESLDEYINYG